MVSWFSCKQASRSDQIGRPLFFVRQKQASQANRIVRSKADVFFFFFSVVVVVVVIVVGFFFPSRAKKQFRPILFCFFRRD